LSRLIENEIFIAVRPRTRPEPLESPLEENEKLYFKIDERGLLLHCFKVDTRIADDAPIHGVIITNLLIRAGDAEQGDGGKRD
jgi:hypothetical protein